MAEYVFIILPVPNCFEMTDNENMTMYILTELDPVCMLRCHSKNALKVPIWIRAIFVIFRVRYRLGTWNVRFD